MLLSEEEKTLPVDGVCATSPVRKFHVRKGKGRSGSTEEDGFYTLLIFTSKSQDGNPGLSGAEGLLRDSRERFLDLEGFAAFKCWAGQCINSRRMGS
ncbi:hypothetical protein D5086_004782 [Populus alba]|uniref:Uncharacterized protein n=1 Tax=Populus alba TaxID=43335 RepID=A0ACC4CSS6_POPAL